MNAPVLQAERIHSPIGEIVVLTDSRKRIRAIDFADCADRMHRLLGRHYGVEGFRQVESTSISPAIQALKAYFAGDLGALDDTLNLATEGTPFQRRVWRALRRIPPGQTLSYGELAARLGHAKAVRAVGLANGANPIAVVTPCHRVVGADGSLTGYGGGLERKRWLLRHEGIRVEGDKVV